MWLIIIISHNVKVNVQFFLKIWSVGLCSSHEPVNEMDHMWSWILNKFTIFASAPGAIVWRWEPQARSHTICFSFKPAIVLWLLGETYTWNLFPTVQNCNSLSVLIDFSTYNQNEKITPLVYSPLRSVYHQSLTQVVFQAFPLKTYTYYMVDYCVCTALQNNGGN